MTTRGKRIGFVLVFGLGGALLALPALTSSPVEASPPTALCSASDSSSSTGRQYAKVSVSPRDPSICIREKLGGEAPLGFPDCWSAASQAGFACQVPNGKIVDLN
jgi:hypothetical protein